MTRFLPWKRLFFFSFLCFFLDSFPAFAQPANDNCADAIPIVISAGGYSLGTFTSAPTNITNATVQTGEEFAPAIFVAGQDKKSVWYRFSLPTTRSLKVILSQPGIQIAAGDAGFAIYQSTNCIPALAEISSKFTPNPLFGDSYHPCVGTGDYLVQVSSKAGASGNIFIRLELGEPSPAVFDKPATAHQFGDLSSNKTTGISFDVDCQTIDDAAENCLPTTSFKDFTKSTWHTFKTAPYFDWLAILLGDNDPVNYNQPDYIVGYRLYEGDVTTTPVSSLVLLSGCDSMKTNGYYPDRKIFRCGEMKTGTSYTIQLLYHKDFNRNMRLGIAWDGTAPTKAPQPVNTIPAPNNLGTLATNSAYHVNNSAVDYLACNSRLALYNCPKTMPPGGLLYNGYTYNLNSYFSFNLQTSTSLNFSISGSCGPGLYARLYKQNLTGNCADLDTANIVFTFLTNGNISCLDSGNYVLQVLGVDSITPRNHLYYGSLYTTNSSLCLMYNLANSVTLNIAAKTEVAGNRFSLSAPGRYDPLNPDAFGVMQPLQPYNLYTAVTDTLGCANTIVPDDALCSPGYGGYKASYRQFVIADSSMLRIGARTTYESKLYKGDANALASAQNIFNYPDKITGLVPMTKCLWYNPDKYACITPGTYTLVSFDTRLALQSNIQVTPLATKTKHATPASAQNLGSLWDSLGVNGGVSYTDVDTFTCFDNPEVIGGLDPCSTGVIQNTKLIYRQFYLNQASSIWISTSYGNTYWTGRLTLFNGKATDGLAGLTPVGSKWTCFTTASTIGLCEQLPVGWYTIVTYGAGSSYDDPTRSTDVTAHYGDVGLGAAFYINLTKACAGPKFNRPHKASIDTTTQKPYLIEWGPQATHTAAYPVTSKKYQLNVENFNCTEDTSFIRDHMKACAPDNAKVAFYVFTTTQESFLQIDGIPNNSAWASLYAFDVRTADSSRLKTDSALHPCLNKQGQLQMCKLLPGTYTLVVYAPSAYSCNAITPTIYIDQVGYSRFDHATNAYDFGTVKADSSWYNGKPGDVNPLNSGRAPSNDFYYCTTGTQKNDPYNSAGCFIADNPFIYQPGSNIVLHPDLAQTPDYYFTDRRNLWYTFTINKPGSVKIRVENKTPGKGYQYPFSVYQSGVDGTLPFAAVVAGGMVDSTISQGLKFIKNNTYYYCYLYSEIEIYNDPCTFTPTRYYVVVDNQSSYPHTSPQEMIPNSQVEVSLLLDSSSAIQPKFDHFSQANDMGIINGGKKQGAVDNFTCATRDATDPLYAYTDCKKTLWYKFTTNITGQVRYSAFLKNTNNYYYDQVQLFQQVLPDDSTSTGLLHLPHTTSYYDNGNWAQRCITPGTYYLILPGCGAVDEDVYPQVEIIPQAGDFCSAPAIAALNGTGAVSATLIPDCHTIGTDYGEFSTTLTCPAGAATSGYKTSWFRLDIGGTDTLDVTAYLVENTNAASTQIKYRLMTGDCGAMQEQSCVQDALTQNTYQCLLPGQQYYVQVFTPVTINGSTVTGTLELKLSAIKHVDTCAPVNTCLASANFTTTFNCTTDEAVRFNNFSTYGTGISYTWDFGIGSQTSSAVSPSFIYPASTTDQTYSIKLVAQNTSCGKKDSVTRSITIPARPYVDLGNDLLQCSGAPVTLDATSFAGASYAWHNGSTDPILQATTVGQQQYFVKVTYNNCISTDTINILISPVAKKALQNIVLCAGDSAVLNAARGVGETYSWNNGAVTAFVDVKIPGVYWVDVRYQGCTVRDSFRVSSISNAVPLGSDTSICLGLGSYLLDASVNGALSYQWQDGSSAPALTINAAGLYWVDINFGNCSVRDSVNISNFASPIIVNTVAAICEGEGYILPWGPTVGTDGIYRDTVRYNSGCDSLITRVALTVKPKPALGADKTFQLCSGKSINLNSQYALTGVNHKWTLNGVAVADPANVTSVGVYELVATNASGCSDTAFVTLGVDQKPLLGADQGLSVCPLTSVNLTTLYNTSGLVPAWSTGGAAVPDPASVMAAGTYVLMATSPAGCIDTAVFTLTASPMPQLGGDKIVSICTGGSVDLNVQYNTTGLNATWSINGNNVSNTGSVSAAGSYQLVATNANGCSDTAMVSISVSPKPSLGPDKDAQVCAGNSFDLSTSFNTSGSTASWTIGGAAVADPSKVYTAGAYQLIVTNPEGCKDTAVLTLAVNQKPNVGADQTVSICAGGTADLTSLFSIAGLTPTWTSSGNIVAFPASVEVAGVYQLIVSNVAGCLDTANVTVNYFSKPNLGADKAIDICQGRIINLTNQFNTSGLASTWTLGGVAIADPARVSTAGIYRLIAANPNGCSDTGYVTLSIGLKPSLGADQSLAICAEKTGDLTGLYNTTGYTSRWSLNNIGVTNPSQVSSGGAYQLIVTTLGGCTDTATVNLVINPKPSLGSDKTLAACTGFNIDLEKEYVTTGLSTTWTTAGQLVPNPRAVNTAGLYQLVATNVFGCADTAAITTVINGKPTLTITDPAPVCAPSTTNLAAAAVTAGSSAGLTFTYWSDVNTSIRVPNESAVSQGLYYVKGTDVNGCVDTKAVNVVVYSLQIALAGKDTTICDQGFAILRGGSANLSGGSVRYLWSPAAGLLRADTANTIANPGRTATYTLTATVDYGPCTVTATDAVVVTMRPPVPLFAGNDTIAMIGVPHQLKASGAQNYGWSPAATLNNPMSATPMATIFQDTKFIVTGTDIAGCPATDTLLVRVFQGTTYYLPNAFSPNGDGLNDVFKPVPANIESLDLFRVYNRYGHLLFETTKWLQGWDGTYKGIKQPVGNYVWVLKATARTGKKIEMKGNVVLVR